MSEHILVSSPKTVQVFMYVICLVSRGVRQHAPLAYRGGDTRGAVLCMLCFPLSSANASARPWVVPLSLHLLRITLLMIMRSVVFPAFTESLKQ